MFEKKKKFVHPEAPSEEELKEIRNKVETKEDELWNEVLDILNGFDSRNTDFKEWEKSENLKGLLTEVGEGYQLLLTKNANFRKYVGVDTKTLTGFICGIRVGYALARKRNGQKW